MTEQTASFGGMSDEHQLRALSLEYADAVTARDAERWGLTWCTDAVWHLGPDREVVGRDAIVELWAGAIAKYDRVAQLYLSSVFSIGAAGDPDAASGRCELLELNRTADGAGHVMAGHYDDTYRRTADGWRFASRRLVKYYGGPPDLSGMFAGD